MPTFREWLVANAREPQPPRTPMFVPIAKQPGTRVLGAGGKWSVVA